MNEVIRNLLEEEIKAEINDLSSLEPGSQEKSDAIDNLAKLYKLRIEEIKNEQDFIDKCERRIMENDQHHFEGEDRYFRMGIAVAEIILPLMFYAVWMRKGFKFEETGTYTSTTFRGLFNRFKPTKK